MAVAPKIRDLRGRAGRSLWGHHRGLAGTAARKVFAAFSQAALVMMGELQRYFPEGRG